MFLISQMAANAFKDIATYTKNTFSWARSCQGERRSLRKCILRGYKDVRQWSRIVMEESALDVIDCLDKNLGSIAHNVSVARSVSVLGVRPSDNELH